MRTLIVTTDKGTKSFEAVYAVATKEATNLIARIKDDRLMSKIAEDFEGIRMLKIDDDDFSLYNELTKVSRASRSEVSLVLRRTL